MVKLLKDYWFEIFVSIMVFFCLLFVVIIAVAPHNDAEMRGFAPCTYQMAEDLGQEVKPDLKMIFGVVTTGYGCYFSVMKQGVVQYFAGKQKTPWANYLFQPIVLDLEDTQFETFPEDLMNANMFDEKVSDVGEMFDDVQENDDEK